LIKLLVSP